jgi:hypothetical protein
MKKKTKKTWMMNTMMSTMGRKEKKTTMERRILGKRKLKKKLASLKTASNSVLPLPLRRGRRTQPPRSFS